MPSYETIGQNLKVKVEGTTMTIMVDLAGPTTLSASGKSDVIATTRGNVKVGDLSIGINVYRKRT